MNFIYALFVFFSNCGYLSFSFFDASDYTLMLRSLASVLILLILFGEKMSRNVIIFPLILCPVLLVQGSYLYANALFITIATLALHRIDRSTLCRIALRIQLLFILYITFLLLSGRHPIGSSNVFGRLRYDCGFENVNNAGVYFNSLFMIYLLMRDKITLPLFLAILFPTAIFFYFTDSRTAFFSLFMQMLLFFALQAKSLKKAVPRILNGFVFLFFISPVLIFQPFIQTEEMNSLLSFRPVYFKEYFNQHSFLTLLLGGSEFAAIDSFYLSFLFNYGLVLYVFLYICVTVTIRRMCSLERFSECSFLTALLSLGLFECSLLSPEVPFCLFFWILIAKYCRSVYRYRSGSQEFMRADIENGTDRDDGKVEAAAAAVNP